MRYRSGHNGGASKASCPERGPWVRIPPSPPVGKRFNMRFTLRSKIHNAIVTDADLKYIGSITIDENLVEKAGFWTGEKVLVVSNTSGARLETYIIIGERGSGVICMNGAAAHLIKKGDEIIVMGFELSDKPLKPINILVNKNNKFIRYL